MIKLIRLRDSAEFIIDGDDKEWRATKIEGIDALTVNVYTETPAIGEGEILTGKHIGRRDINVEAHRSSQKEIPKARDTVMSFFNPNDTYTMEIKYNGKDLYIDCELLAYKLPTENIYRPLNLTFTMLCHEPYFYLNEKTETFYSKTNFIVGGQVETTPKILINQYLENEFNIEIDDYKTIRIILDDKYTKIFNHILELDCKYGTLNDLTSQENLTNCILSDNPIFKLFPKNCIITKHSYKREKTTGKLTITSNYTATANFHMRLRELEVVFSDGFVDYYDCSQNNTYSHSSFIIEITDTGFTFHGQTGSYITYTAILDDTGNRSSLTVIYKELYMGF